MILTNGSHSKKHIKRRIIKSVFFDMVGVKIMCLFVRNTNKYKHKCVVLLLSLYPFQINKLKRSWLGNFVSSKQNYIDVDDCTTKKNLFQGSFYGGREETRTPMPKALDPKSSASTNFATRPYSIVNVDNYNL